MSHPKDIPVTLEEEIYWQEIEQVIEISNQQESLFTVDDNTWEKFGK